MTERFEDVLERFGLTRDDLTSFEQGWLDGVWTYAWWKEGVAYVGTTGSTYAGAVERFLLDRGRVPLRPA